MRHNSIHPSSSAYERLNLYMHCIDRNTWKILHYTYRSCFAMETHVTKLLVFLESILPHKPSTRCFAYVAHAHNTKPKFASFFFLTHCKYLLWLGLGLVRSHHQIVIRVGWFAKVRRFLRTPARSFYSDVNGLTLQIKSQQRALNLTTSLCIFMLSCTL